VPRASCAVFPTVLRVRAGCSSCGDEIHSSGAWVTQGWTCCWCTLQTWNQAGSPCALHRYRCNETRFLKSWRASVSLVLARAARAWLCWRQMALLLSWRSRSCSFCAFFLLSTIIPPYQGCLLGFYSLDQHIQVRLFSTELWKYLGLLDAAFRTLQEQHDVWTLASHRS